MQLILTDTVTFIDTVRELDCVSVYSSDDSLSPPPDSPPAADHRPAEIVPAPVAPVVIFLSHDPATPTLSPKRRGRPLGSKTSPFAPSRLRGCAAQAAAAASAPLRRHSKCCSGVEEWP